MTSAVRETHPETAEFRWERDQSCRYKISDVHVHVHEYLLQTGENNKQISTSVNYHGDYGTISITVHGAQGSGSIQMEEGKSEGRKSSEESEEVREDLQFAGRPTPSKKYN